MNMAKKALLIFGLWVFIVCIYIGMAFLMPIWNTVMAATPLAAGTEQLSTQYFIESSPVWAWFIPGLACSVVVTLILTQRESAVRM